MEEKINQLTFTNAALFGLLIAIAYFFLFYNPANPQNVLDQLDKELITARGEIAKLDRGLKEGSILKQEIEVMQKTTEKAYRQLSERISVKQVAATISQEARSVGLSIDSIVASNNWVKKRTLASVNIQTAVTGSFPQIMVFLSELTRDNKVYSVSDFAIEAEKGDGNGTKGLQLNVKIKAYRKLALSEINTKQELNGGSR